MGRRSGSSPARQVRTEIVSEWIHTRPGATGGAEREHALHCHDGDGKWDADQAPVRRARYERKSFRSVFILDRRRKLGRAFENVFQRHVANEVESDARFQLAPGYGFTEPGRNDV